MSLTHLNPNALPDSSISSSKIDATVASKSYVDEAIASAITKTLTTAV